MNRVINSLINTVKKIKSEIFGKISDFIFLHVEKIKSEIFVPFGHRRNGHRRKNISTYTVLLFL